MISLFVFFVGFVKITHETKKNKNNETILKTGEKLPAYKNSVNIGL